MSELSVPYITAQSAAEFSTVPFEVTTWERNLLLQMRQAAQRGYLVVCDPDARCWWTTGKMQCNKEDKIDLPFKMT